MNRARAIQANTSVSPLFSAARVYMDFVNGFYIHRTPSDFTGTPSITAGLGLFVNAAGNSVSLQSTAFSSWFNGTAGTVYVEFVRNSAGASPAGRAWNISDGTSTEMIELQYSAPNELYGVTDGGASQALLGVVPPAFGSITKTASAFAANDFRFAVNGASAGDDTAGTLPTVTRIDLGNRPATDRAIDGYIRRFAFFSTALTNAEMQALTN